MRTGFAALAVLGVLALHAPNVSAEAPPAPVLFWGTLGSGPTNLDQPFGIATDAIGKLYVADQHNNRVSIFGPTGDLLGQFSYSGFSDPTGITVAPDGSIWVTSHHNHLVFKFTSTGTHLLTLGGGGVGYEPGKFAYPLGVVADDAGNIYVTQLINARVQKFSSDGTLLMEFGNAGAGALSSPYGIDVVGGIVYVSDLWSNTIKKYVAADGAYLGSFGSPGSGPGQFNGPEGISHDALGNLFICDGANNRIQKLTAAGTPLSTFGGFGVDLGKMYGPSDVVVDPTGDIFVAEWNNARIQRFSYSSPTPTRSVSWGGLKKTYR
jgi:DNA-binding beta-propeller fold protein YncE